MVQTNRENFQQKTRYIPLDSLPQTFRDSIILCRQLGIRYLWIDCLCIIQDDDEDWQKECEKMAGIYENSYLTISALSAKDSSEGLFQLRTQKEWQVVLRTLDGTSLGFRASSKELASDVESSTMGCRGWILQEKILSPAILHFGELQLHWECRKGTSSEVWANVQNPTSGYLKNILHEAQREGCDSYPQGHFIAWYMVVQHYSRMNLKTEYDRLPAILGIAQRFELSFGVTFVAGLWVEDIHRGLLWSRFITREEVESSHSESEQESRKNSANAPVKCATAPSWSWVSNMGHNIISFEWEVNLSMSDTVHPVERLHSDMDVELVDAMVTPCPEVHRGAVKGVLAAMWHCCTSLPARKTSQSLRVTVGIYSWISRISGIYA